jgi:hypothetical protein
LYKIARYLVAAKSLKIECHYLFASRRALHLPGHINIAESRSWILEDTDHLSITTIADRLNLAASDLLSALNQTSKLDPAKNLTASERKDVASLFERHQVISLIDKASKRSLDNAKGYFEQAGLISKENTLIGIVDVGWHGRIQRSLENILKKLGVPSNTVRGYYLALNDKSVFSLKDQFRLKCFINTPNRGPRGEWILEHVEMIELLHAADHPSVVRYNKTENGLFGAELGDSSLKNGARFRQDAILAFAKNYAQSTTSPLAGPLSALNAERDLRRLLERPSRLQALLFSSYEHSEHQNEQASTPFVLSGISLRNIFRGPRAKTHGWWPNGSHAANRTLVIYLILRRLVKTKKRLFAHLRPIA